jgi:hypothetical protein
MVKQRIEADPGPGVRFVIKVTVRRDCIVNL